MEIIKATCPVCWRPRSTTSRKPLNSSHPLPAVLSSLTNLSFLGPLWCGSLPCTPCLCCGWAWGCQQGQESERRARHGGVRVGRFDYQLNLLGTSISICPSPHLIQTTFREQWPLLTSTFQISRMFLFMANSKWNHTGKAMLGNSSHFNQLDRTQAICVVRKLPRKWALSWDPRMRMCQPQEGSRQELPDRGMIWAKA